MTMFPAFPYFLKGKSIIMWTKNGKDAQIYKDESFFFLPPLQRRILVLDQSLCNTHV